MSRSFRDLPPQEALGLGIAVETRNAQRYESFALLFAGYDEDVSRLFTEMRDEELEHRAALQELYRARFGDRPCALDEADVDDVVEAVDIDDAEHLVFNTMTLKKVLEAALRAEQGAQRFYAGLSETVQDKDLLALYRQLGENEQDHVTAVVDRIRQLDEEKGANSHGRIKN